MRTSFGARDEIGIDFQVLNFKGTKVLKSKKWYNIVIERKY